MADADEDTPVPLSSQNDVELDDETQDFRLLSSFNLNGVEPPSLPRRGEKDFEPNPTQHQRSALDGSRQAMHDALSYPRLHHPKNHVIGYYHPESTTDSFVAVENARGPFYRTMGTADRQNTVWLLPEEALWLLERGTLDIRWAKTDDDTEGIPMSLEAAYSQLLGKSGLTLERYHVYAGLRRIGYTVRRAATWHEDAVVPATDSIVARNSNNGTQGLLGFFRQILNTLFLSTRVGNPATGPLVAPGLYRSYDDIYRTLSLISSYKPDDVPNPPTANPKPPFRISFDVYKPATPYKKSAPPPPDFRLVVLDARTTQLPRLDEIATLLDSLAQDPPHEDKKLEVKLKWGYRNVILAVVDTGVVSYLRLSDAAFGQNQLYKQRSKAARKGGQRRGQGKPGGKR